MILFYLLLYEDLLLDFAPVAIDSTNFLKTKSLGVAPQNTTMVVNYRQGGGVAGNVGPKLLNRFIRKQN